MLLKSTFILSFVFLSCTSVLFGEDNSIPKEKLSELDGNWHLRVADGKGTRRARTILEFDSGEMKIKGFDGCNKISGTLVIDANNTMSSKLIATRMACREPIHAYASKMLHETLAEGFTTVHASSNGVNGIMLKSAHHTLFFKKMGGESKKEESIWPSFDFKLDLDYDFDFGSKTEPESNETNASSPVTTTPATQN